MSCKDNYLDGRYRSVEQLLNYAELVPRDVYVARCIAAKLSIVTDHLTKRGLVKALTIDKALVAESPVNPVPILFMEDLTGEGIRALANKTDEWLVSRMESTLAKNKPIVFLTELQKREEDTKAFISTLNTKITTPTTDLISSYYYPSPNPAPSPSFATNLTSSHYPNVTLNGFNTRTTNTNLISYYANRFQLGPPSATAWRPRHLRSTPQTANLLNKYFPPEA